MRVRSVPDPKAHWMRPTLPCTLMPEPPPDRDSTRVVIMPSKKAWVVFGRDANGWRPPQVPVGSIAIAEQIVREHKVRQIIWAFMAWLANMLPRDGAPSSSRLPAAKSGVRPKPSDEVSRRRYGR